MPENFLDKFVNDPEKMEQYLDELMLRIKKQLKNKQKNLLKSSSRNTNYNIPT